jgi:hypothetical protein
MLIRPSNLMLSTSHEPPRSASREVLEDALDEFEGRSS